MLDTSRRGTSTRIQSIDSVELDRIPGPVDDDHPGPAEHLVDALPGVDPCRGVVTDDRVQRGIRVFSAIEARVSAVYEGPPVRSLVVAGHELGDVGDGGLDHRQPVDGGGDVALADLLPRHVGDHQDHQIERQGVSDVDSGHKVPDVRWIEGPPEYPDVQGLFGGRRHGRSVYGAFYRSRRRSRPDDS